MPPYQSNMFRPEEATMLNHIEWYGYKIEVVLCICLVTLVFRLVLLVTWLPHAHVQGAIGLVCLLSVIVIVVTKIARSRVLGIYACCNYHKLVDIGEKKNCWSDHRDEGHLGGMLVGTLPRFLSCFASCDVYFSGSLQLSL